MFRESCPHAWWEVRLEMRAHLGVGTPSKLRRRLGLRGGVRRFKLPPPGQRLSGGAGDSESESESEAESKRRISDERAPGEGGGPHPPPKFI